MMDSSIILHPIYESYNFEYKDLYETFIELFQYKENLVNHTAPLLEAEYMIKLGNFQLQLLQAEVKNRTLKRKIELILAALNTNKTPDLNDINDRIEYELNEWKMKIETLTEDLINARKTIDNVLSDAENKEMKYIFKKLVKMFHPDLNPNQNKKQREFWLKIIKVHKEGNLNELKNLDLFSEHLIDSTKNNNYLDKPEDLERRNELLKERIKKIRNDIEKIKESYPFILEILVNDKMKVRQEQKKLTEAKEALEQQIVLYEDILSHYLMLINNGGYCSN